MGTEKNYLSELEQEWNSDQEITDVQNDEFDSEDDEFDSEDDEFDNESDDFEVTAEDESDYENEFQSDDEHESTIDDEIDPDNGINNEFTDRLYSVLSGDHETELQFEQDLNEVLHEVEKDYFWGGLKRRFKKFKNSGLFTTLKKLANKTPLGDAIKQYTALARGDIKGMLKGLAGQALTSMVPGGAQAKQLLNLEVPVSSSNPKKNAQVINTVAKKAYSNLINQLGTINSRDQLSKIKSMGKNAYNKAWQQTGSRSNRTRRILLNRGDKLIIKVL